jgi:DNA-binding beta-propeller fold protein YncE
MFVVFLLFVVSLALTQRMTARTYVGDDPRGVAVSMRGDAVYVSNFASGSVSRISLTNDTDNDNTFITGLGAPAHVAQDADENLYVSDGKNKTIAKFDRNGTLLEAAFGGPLDFTPAGLVFDATFTTLYVFDTQNGTIRTITNGKLNAAMFASNFGTGYSQGLDFDSTGALIVPDRAQQRLFRVLANGTKIEFVKQGLNRPRDVVVDCLGRVFVTNNPNGEIKMVPAGETVALTYFMSSNLTDTIGIDLDDRGNFYVVENNLRFVATIDSGNRLPLQFAKCISNLVRRL